MALFSRVSVTAGDFEGDPDRPLMLCAFDCQVKNSGAPRRAGGTVRGAFTDDVTPDRNGGSWDRQRHAASLTMRLTP